MKKLIFIILLLTVSCVEYHRAYIEANLDVEHVDGEKVKYDCYTILETSNDLQISYRTKTIINVKATKVDTFANDDYWERYFSNTSFHASDSFKQDGKWFYIVNRDSTYVSTGHGEIIIPKSSLKWYNIREK